MRSLLSLKCLFILAYLLLCTTLICANPTDEKPHETPVYIPPKEAKNLQCSKFFDPHANFTDYKKNRLTYFDPKDEKDLPMSCEAIKKRSYFQTEDLYPEERDHPIAFSKTVYRDYRFIEMELATTYAPQNFYCFALDAKASPLFHKRMKALAECFPNVYLTTHEFKMDSSGHNMIRSHFECIKLLAEKGRNWKYLLMLQNHDIMLKTNQELIQIFKWYNGTNAVSANFERHDRINKELDWTFKALDLFKNKSRNYPHAGYTAKMRFAKTSLEVALSRAMVDFMLDELDFTKLIANFESKSYGVDEFFFSSINSADEIQAPGGFTMHCLDKYKKQSNSLIRLVYWKPTSFCLTNIWRHSVCLMGMENMDEFAYTPFLFANKILPRIDFGAIACWHEKMFNRTHFERGLHRLDESIYLNVAQVRFNRERKLLGDKFDLSKFKCTL